MFYLNYFKSAFLNKKIKIFNYGKHYRDFTYIGDVIDILMKMQPFLRKYEDRDNFIKVTCGVNSFSLKSMLHFSNRFTR